MPTLLLQAQLNELGLQRPIMKARTWFFLSLHGVHALLMMRTYCGAIYSGHMLSTSSGFIKTAFVGLLPTRRRTGRSTTQR